MKTKQVILVRKDLNMRKGKMIAQGSHASMKVILDIMRKYKTSDKTTVYNLEFGEDSVLSEWLEGKFTKVCLGVNSKDELIEYYNKAKELSIPCSLIIDSGLTEFNGVPTETCVAIGPYYSEEIDKITGNLKLL
jgi:PTH2 family peptidyl-tRNA hydrolase